MRRRDDERLPSDNPPPVEPPAEPPDAFVIELEITEPTSSQALTGPWNGVTVNVAGKAKIASGSGSIGRVEVQVGSGEFKPAAATQAGWATWSAAEMVTTSGTQAIIARAIDGNGNVARERTVTITTTLEPKPAEPEDPPTDTTPPSVAIVSPQPAETFVLDGAGRAEISIAGRAGDVGAGLDRVEVTVDGLPAEVSKLDGWSNWTVRAPLIGEGRHTVSARAYDGAGLHSTAYVEVATATEPPAPPDVERLLVVLKCQLSSYLGAYGTGHVVKTVSLLPGESTEIAVKSYRRSSERSSEASSILDSTSTDSENSFERLVQQEQSSKRASAESQEWSVAGNATVGWGWGSASVSAGAAGGSNAALEEISKNLMHALGKHSARASSKREVQVNTSREMNREEGEESSSQSRIENINLSRTLNFVFRQMNQEYLSILHLVDVRVAYVRGDEDEREAVTERTSSESGPRMRWSYQEVTLSQVDGLLRQVIVPERRDDVRREIINVLTHVSDYEDEIHSIVEERAVEQPDGTPVPGARYLRFPKRKVSRYTDAATGTEIAVPGVILAVSRNVMRTDGVIADAILGQGESLDAYNKGLQSAVVKARTLENGRQAAALDKDRVAIELVRGNDAERAQVFRKVYPVRGTEGLALATIDANGPGQDGSG